MKVSKEEVLHTAKLAKLKIEDETADDFADKMSSILIFASKLNELDLKDVKPLYNPVDLTNVLREDSVKECLEIEETLKNAPSKEGRYFSVPKML